MTNQDFQIWLIKNGHNQKSLAHKLGISAQTITAYNNNNNYPLIFQYALRGVETEQKDCTK